ncbi:MAG: helix-turn-helix transcriptional regulator [Bacteroidota bacterium]
MADGTPTYVSTRELPLVIRQLREEQGLTRARLAHDLDVDEGAIAAAEGQSGRDCQRLRRRLLERLTGCTMSGPFYRLA